jgi:hypothetical protein
MADVGNLKKVVIKTLVTQDNFHLEVPEFIHKNKRVIDNYEDLANVVFDMLKARYFFNIEKNHLKDLMDDLVFIFNPGSEENIARVQNLIYDSDSESDMSGDDGEDGRFEEIIEKKSKKSDKKRS